MSVTRSREDARTSLVLKFLTDAPPAKKLILVLGSG
jgi:hypothetical protein